jgi:hypothetical protein
MLELAPNVLLRVDFGSVRGKVLDRQSIDGIELAKFIQFRTLVDLGTVPQQQDSFGDVHQQVSDKPHRTLGANRRTVNLDVQATLKCQPSYDRQMIATNRARQNRRTTNRAPSLDDGRCHVEGRLIDENDHPAFLFGFLWSAGQVTSSHSRTTRSSRSDARTMGFWYDHWSRCISRRTCSGWYITPNSCAMTRAMRRHVHNSPEKPNAPGPRSRKAGRRDNCWSERCLACPRLDLGRSASSPSSRAFFSHWLTAGWVTPSASAIDASVQPSARSSAALTRRHSFDDASILARLPSPPMWRSLPHPEA